MLSVAARKYRLAVAVEIMRLRLPSLPLRGRLAVDIECRPPDHRRRDLDNLPKSILDALTHAGVWLDDAQIDELRIWRSNIGGFVLVSVVNI